VFEVFHCYWFLAQGAGVIAFEPAFDALRVKEVAGVARQWSDLVVWLIVDHANHALFFSGLVRVELALDHAFDDVGASRLPSRIRSLLPSIRSQDLWGEASENKADGATLADRHESQYD